MFMSACFRVICAPFAVLGLTLLSRGVRGLDGDDETLEGSTAWTACP